MARAAAPASTQATRFLRSKKAPFQEHVYDYVERGGAAESARQLGWPLEQVIKTLILEDENRQPLVMLMHGDREVSTRSLGRALGRKHIGPCEPATAERHSGYRVGGTSPFGLKRAMPIYVEESILALPRILINGGRRGYLIEIEPSCLVSLLQAQPVSASQD